MLIKFFLISLESSLGKYILGYVTAEDKKTAQEKVLEKIKTRVPLEKITISCDNSYILVGDNKINISVVEEFSDLPFTLF